MVLVDRNASWAVSPNGRTMVPVWQKGKPVDSGDVSVYMSANLHVLSISFP